MKDWATPGISGEQAWQSRRHFLRLMAAGLSTSAFSGLSLFPGIKPAPGRTRPNILFIFSDQQHWQAAGFQDPFFTTPHLDRLAEKSVVFDRMFCPTPQCSPARSSLMTGLYPSKTGVMGNMGALGGTPLSMETIGRELQRAGYHTGYFGKWHLGGNPVANAGWDDEWKKINDPEVTKRGTHFLTKAAGGDRPFALFLSYLNPHDVYHVDPKAFNRQPPAVQKEIREISLPLSWQQETFEGKPSVQKEFMTSNQGERFYELPRQLWQYYRYYYREKVRLYDQELGQVLQTIRNLNLLEDTIIIVTADHGDMDTNHRLIFKGPFMYEHMVRIPLVIRVPPAFHGQMARRVTRYDVVSVDLAPTIRDFAGLEEKEADGYSLRPILTGGTLQNERKHVIGQYYGKQQWVSPIRMVRTEQYKYNNYIHYGEELYDLHRDPNELTNQAENPEYQDVKQSLRETLDAWIAQNNDPFYSLHATHQDGETIP